MVVLVNFCRLSVDCGDSEDIPENHSFRGNSTLSWTHLQKHHQVFIKKIRERTIMALEGEEGVIIIMKYTLHLCHNAP